MAFAFRFVGAQIAFSWLTYAACGLVVGPVVDEVTEVAFLSTDVELLPQPESAEKSAAVKTANEQNEIRVLEKLSK
jgi:hypothetical protein